MKVDDILVKMIKRISLFSNITDEDAKEFATHFKLNFYMPWKTIIRQWEYPKKIYIVKSWKLDVLRANALKNIKLAELGPGDIFGEMSYFTGDPAMASVVSNTEVDLWEIPRDVFAKFLDKYKYIYDHAWEVFKKRQEENKKKLDNAKQLKDDDNIDLDFFTF